MRAVLWLSVASIASSSAAAASPQSLEAGARDAIRKSVVFLDEDAVRWREENGCASCHHAPMMLWALGEAKAAGYAVDDAAMAMIAASCYAPGGDAKIFPDAAAAPSTDASAPSSETAETASGGAQPAAAPGKAKFIQQLPLLALALADRPRLDAADRDAIDRAAALLVTQQSEDGSWGHDGDIGRPPILDTRDITTLWTAIALTIAPAGGARRGALEASLDKARRWLGRHDAAVTHQSTVLRLLLDLRQGRPEVVIAAAAGDLLRAQNTDGGWSQAPGMASDAYATGQTLYVLGRAGIDRSHPSVTRATAFLVGAQRADGSWPMTSRPVRNGGSEPAKNLVPITYAGSAWATLGLLTFWSAEPPAATATAAR